MDVKTIQHVPAGTWPLFVFETGQGREDLARVHSKQVSWLMRNMMGQMQRETSILN